MNGLPTFDYLTEEQVMANDNKSFEPEGRGSWDYLTSFTTLPSGVHLDRQMMSIVYTLHFFTHSFMYS